MDARRVEDRGARIGKPVKPRAYRNLAANDVLLFSFRVAERKKRRHGHAWKKFILALRQEHEERDRGACLLRLSTYMDSLALESSHYTYNFLI